MDSCLEQFKEFYFTIKPALIRVIAREENLNLDDYKARENFISNALKSLDSKNTELSDLYCDYLMNVSENVYIYQLDIFEYIERYFFDPMIIRDLQDERLIRKLLSSNARPKSISGYLDFVSEGSYANPEFLDMYYVALSALETIFYIWLCCNSRYASFSESKRSLLQMSILNSFTRLGKISERYFSDRVLKKLFPPQRVYAKKVKSLHRTYRIYKFLRAQKIYGTPSHIARSICRKNQYGTLNAFLEQSGQKPFDESSKNFVDTLTKAISRPLKSSTKLKSAGALDEVTLKIAIEEFEQYLDL